MIHRDRETAMMRETQPDPGGCRKQAALAHGSGGRCPLHGHHDAVVLPP